MPEGASLTAPGRSSPVYKIARHNGIVPRGSDLVNDKYPFWYTVLQSTDLIWRMRDVQGLVKYSNCGFRWKSSTENLGARRNIEAQGAIRIIVLSGMKKIKAMWEIRL